jgi:OmpA-OmpF porin, OOP family
MAVLDTTRSSLDAVVGDVANQFGLGASAGPLVRELLNMITGSPGGLGGFLDKFKSAGLSSELGSWLGRADAPALSAQQVDSVLGSNALTGIASRLGLGGPIVASAVGYALPKLIGALTPGGRIPTYMPSELTNLLSPSIVPRSEPTTPWPAAPAPAPAPRFQEQVRPRHIEVVHDEPHMSRWLWPLLGALGVLGLGSLLFSGPRAPVTPTVVQTPVVQPIPAAPTLPANLTLTNDNGIIHYSGSVHDEDTRTSIINSLKAVFGADKVQGDIGIDLNRGAAPWLVNLRTALGNLKVPGVQAAFDGNAVNLGGVLSDADRDRISGSLKSVLGSGVVVGTLADRLANIVSDANSKAVTALASLKSGFGPNDLTGILNDSVINFSSGQSEVPATAKGLLQDAANRIKQLPPNTVLEIAGYTDNTGNEAANVALSQQRADAVRDVLINGGVSPSMLVAKGYGSANPVASNDLLEGRFRNRRIEYHTVRT